VGRELTREIVRETFRYQDGQLFWKYPRQGRQIHKAVGSITNRGYLLVRIDGVGHLVHRLIWTYFYGPPDQVIDHIDRNPLNNHIENLRDVSQNVNIKNAGLRSNNTSGYTNIHWLKQKQRWIVLENNNYRSKRLGSFKTLEEAVIFQENYNV
jgi:hypothetical protein